MPATVGVVIDLVLPVCCIIPDLVRLNADNIPLLRPAQDGLVHHIADGIGCCLGLLTAVWVRIDRSVLSLDILAVRRWLTARYVKRLTTVSATTCGSNRFSKEKNGWRPARR